MHISFGRLVINTFDFPLFGVDLIRRGERILLVLDLGWFSLGWRIKRG